MFKACETGEGDSRAALGLAGVALRAGARNTLAILWRVSDRSTAELMVKFYHETVRPFISIASGGKIQPKNHRTFRAVSVKTS